MKECRYIRSMFIKALFNELEGTAKEKFQEHLENCSQCTLDFQNKKQTLEFMKLRKVNPPASKFWEEFQDKLFNRLEEEKSFSEKLKKRKVMEFIPLPNFPKWSYQLAAAVLLLCIGFFIGKQYFSPETTQITGLSSQSTVPLIPTAIESDAYNYIERSKVLLMGIVNMDEDFQPASALDFSLQSQKAQSLVEQANYLKENLSEPSQRKLRSLISDLEAILIQIANLEARHDLSAVEVIKVGTEQKAIFLKINLYELNQVNLENIETKKLLETSNKNGI
jgi:hypothetical protein